MRRRNSITGAGLLMVLSASLLACDKFDPIPASKCGKIVSRSKKLLGKQAEARNKAMTTCKEASDEQRGCAMAASSAADLLRCSI